MISHGSTFQVQVYYHQVKGTEFAAMHQHRVKNEDERINEELTPDMILQLVQIQQVSNFEI